MSPTQLFYVLLVIIIFGFAFDQWINYLNTTTWSTVLPEALIGYYDEQTYHRQQEYEKVNYRFGLVSDLLSLLGILAMLWLGGFAWIDSIAHGISENNTIFQALLFFGILALASDILSIPLEVYHTFVIEKKYGFNNTSPKTFVMDKLKGWFLAAIIGGGILSLVIFIFEKSGQWFWVLAWVSISVFSIFLSYFYTTLLVPLFNKLSPLPDCELRDEIELVAVRAGFNLKDISIMDGSKRSTRGNAYFSGFGRKKSIVLYDTLVENHSTDELVAVIAHEIGHYKKKHILKGLITGLLQTGILLFILSLLLKSSMPALALGAVTASFHMSLVAFGILYSPVSMALGILSNVILRRNEFEADKYAVGFSKLGALQLALKKISVKNLSNLTPHPWYEFVHYSHPSLLQRLEAIESATKQNS
jgi:STE24 endopeptidase